MTVYRIFDVERGAYLPGVFATRRLLRAHAKALRLWPLPDRYRALAVRRTK